MREKYTYVCTCLRRDLAEYVRIWVYTRMLVQYIENVMCIGIKCYF